VKFLAINTAATRLQVALQIDNKIFAKSDNNYKKASEVASVYVDELLAENSLTLADLDFCAVVVGPGSFTGVRIGISMARIFGQFGTVPLVGINSLEVIASKCRVQSAECRVVDYLASVDKVVVAVADAANGFSYIAVYENAVELLSPSVIKTSELSGFLDTIDEAHIVIDEKDILHDNGAALCAAGLSAYKKNGATTYENILPLYIRKSQAEENLA